MDECLVFTGEVVMSEPLQVSGEVSLPVIFTQPPLSEEFVTYTANGDYEITPSTGYPGMSQANVKVDVPPPPIELQDKRVEYTRNGEFSVTFDESFRGLDTVDVRVAVAPILSAKDVEYTENGTYKVLPDPDTDGISETSVTVNVNPPLEAKEIVTYAKEVEVLPSEGYYGLSSAKVTFEEEPIPDWKPNPTWWDIKAILDASEYKDPKYGCRYIVLIDNSFPTSVFNMLNIFSVVRTSDGATYTSNTVHTWDTTKDKPCIINGQETYKTRWYIVYASSGTVFQANHFKSVPLLYVVFDNIGMCTEGSLFADQYLLEAVEYVNGSYFYSTSSFYAMFRNCYSLQYVSIPEILPDSTCESAFSGCHSLRTVDININIALNIDSMFFNCYSLIKAPDITKPFSSLYQTFYGCTSLKQAPQINFSEATNVSALFSNSGIAGDVDIILPKATNIDYLFSNALSLSNVKVEAPVATSAENFVYGIKGLKSLYLNGPKITNVKGICNSCHSIKSATILFDNDKNVDIHSAFVSCYSLNFIDVTAMSYAANPSGIFSSSQSIIALYAIISIPGINLSANQYLLKDSLLYLLNNLVPTDTTKILQLGYANLQKITDEEKAIATNKGWTLS